MATKRSPSSGPKPEQYSPRVPGTARGGEERLQRVDGPGGRAGREGGHSSNPTRPPTSKPAGGQHPPTLILPQRHFRRLSRNPGGLEALWSAPRPPPAPAHCGVARPQGPENVRARTLGVPRMLVSCAHVWPGSMSLHFIVLFINSVLSQTAHFLMNSC